MQGCSVVGMEERGTPSDLVNSRCLLEVTSDRLSTAACMRSEYNHRRIERVQCNSQICIFRAETSDRGFSPCEVGHCSAE